MKLRLVGALTGAVAVVAMLATSVPAASAAPALTQTYSCSSSVGTISASATLKGNAAENPTSTVINLTNVVYKVTNPVASQVTIDHVKVSVPDPKKSSAPYVANSAKVGTAPPGWTAGHDATGVFALFPGSMTVASGGSVANAPLQAMYTDKGPAGTVINFTAGQISFNVTSPIGTTATCKPTPPVRPFATVKE